MFAERGGMCLSGREIIQSKDYAGDTQFIFLCLCPRDPQTQSCCHVFYLFIYFVALLDLKTKIGKWDLQILKGRYIPKYYILPLT